MKIARPTLAAGLAALCAFASLAAAPAAALAQAAPTIGIVNIQKVFNTCKEVNDIKQQFSSKASGLEAQKSAAQAQVNSLQESRKSFNPGSTEYTNVNNEIIKAATTAQVQIQMAQQDLMTQQKVQTKAVFAKIDDVIKKLAGERNLSLVISQLAPDVDNNMLETLNPDQLNQALFSRSVLFAAPNLDLTSEVVVRLDAAYASSGPAPTPTPTPTPAPAH